MKPARIAVLAIAIVAGGSAAFLMNRTPEPVVTQAAAPAANTVDVLVAAVDVSLGKAIQPAELRWLPWPADSIPAGVIVKKDQPQAITELAGSFAKLAILANEPIRRERILKADGSGYLSAILPSGKRAVAITTERSGATTAGGFILPNDRVDVIRTTRGGDNSSANTFASDTILANVRVLAIGQAIQEKDGEKVVVGETATLELEPREAEAVALAQKTGQLSLALRSLADANEVSARPSGEDGNFSVVRFGVTERVTRQ